jgi:hypothetical protein
MPRIGSLSVEDIEALRLRLQSALAELGGEPSFERASERFVEVLFEELEESAVLFRVFATVSLGLLPSKEREFALRLARERDFAEEVTDTTPVVALFATRGKQPSWNHRHLSRNHLAIPLTRASFIKTIPMVSRLMSDMGTGLEWVEKQQLNMVVKTMGQMARVLYVEDAATATTGDGFKVVPDQDFVEEHGVRTVLGLGGAYLNRTILAIALFTNELVPRDRVDRLLPLLHGFKVATMKSVMQKKFFEPS